MHCPPTPLFSVGIFSQLPADKGQLDVSNKLPSAWLTDRKRLKTQFELLPGLPVMALLFKGLSCGYVFLPELPVNYCGLSRQQTTEDRKK
jgi:hypothetical protein